MREPRVRPASAARVAIALLLSLAPIAAGCYSVRPPYNENIKTVYVPIFRSVTFRRDVNMQLTEEVIKEIERRTPYKVVGKPEGADAVLDGVINFTDKNLVVENPFNLPRQLTANMTVAVTFTPNDGKKKKPEPVLITEVFNFFPEVGETSMAAFLRTNQKLAQQIVGMMENPW